MNDRETIRAEKFRNAVMGPVNNDLELLSAESIQEAHEKGARIRRFYLNPDQDEKTRFWLPEFAYSFLQEFKPVTPASGPIAGSKRKDGVTENRLHEIDPLLLMQGYYRAGILPPQVTYQVIKGSRYPIPQAAQSVELLFALEAIHDTDEDFPDVSRSNMEQYIYDSIFSSEIPEKLRSKYYEMVPHLGAGLDAITLGRKTYAEDGKTIIEEETHEGDPHLCFNALERIWFGIGAKAPDKIGGTVTRFSQAPTKFTIEGHIDYGKDIRRLFMNRQTLEHAVKRYPELAEYFTVLNAKLRVAYVVMDSIIQDHPENPRKPKKGRYRPSTARIDIAQDLPAAFKYSEFIDNDVHPEIELLRRIQAEANRHTELQPIVDQVYDQIEPFLRKLIAPHIRLGHKGPQLIKGQPGS